MLRAVPDHASGPRQRAEGETGKMKVKARRLNVASGAGFPPGDPPGAGAWAGRHPFFSGLPGDRAWVAAHRGGMNHWPENTLFAFERALETGVHMLEMDVRLAADGVPVIMHDETVDRTTSGRGPVRAFTFQQLRSLDAACRWSGPAEPGSRPYRGRGMSVPTLDDVFAAFPDARLVIEVKEPGKAVASAVGDLVRRYGRVDRTIVASFHTSLLRSFRARYPEVATSAGRAEVLRFWLLQKLFLPGLARPDYVALQVPERSRGTTVVTPRFVGAARGRDLSVQVWTVNDPRDMNRLLHMGVEALITDEPGLALELTASRAR